MKEKIKAIDLFSGCGGVSIGLKNAGFDVVCAVEIDNDAVKAYKGYHLLSNVNVFQRDICTLSGEKIAKAAGCPGNQKAAGGTRRRKGSLLIFFRFRQSGYTSVWRCSQSGC